MNDIFLYSLISTVGVSAIAFVGIFGLLLNRQALQKILLYLVSFSIGALLGDTFVHILPEAYEKLGLGLQPALLLMGGFLLFFVLEKFLRWRHCHDSECQKHIKPMATLNLIGDAAHNIIDGMFIAASYIVSLPMGLATTMAVLLHEVPHELGNFGVLIHYGVEAKKAIFYNFATGLASVAGALFVLFFSRENTMFAYWLLPITAGGFLYVAGSDLIPELHQENDWKKSLIQFIFICLGVLVMMLIK